MLAGKVKPIRKSHNSFHYPHDNSMSFVCQTQKNIELFVD